LQPEDPNFETQANSVNANSITGGYVSRPPTPAPAPGDYFFGTIWPNAGSPQSISKGDSIINDVNNIGDAVGYFGFQNTPTSHAFLLRGSSVIDLVPTVPEGSRGTGLNNNGLVVAGSVSALLLEDLFMTLMPKRLPRLYLRFPVWTGPQRKRSTKTEPWRGLVGLLTGATAFYSPVVEDINDAGVVVGSAGKAFPEDFHAVICDTTKPTLSFTELPLPPGFVGSHGNAINNNGDVVGTCWTPTTRESGGTAYICTGGVSTDLNTLISANSGWKLQYASDINDRCDRRERDVERTGARFSAVSNTCRSGRPSCQVD
jgi:uncharacterized membrane protein